MKLIKIGELAKEAGITVKSLHHYDKIGLLQATQGRESGHRLYSREDLERLQQILSLKSMGFSLEKIAQCLDEEAYDLQKTLTMQKECVLARIQQLQSVDQTLRLLLTKLSLSEHLTNKELFSFMKEVQNMEKLYTPEQVQILKDRYEKFPEKVKEVENAWPILFKKFEDAMNRGLSTSDPTVQVLAKQAQEYIDLFTGGDKEIEANLDKAHKENREGALKTWGVSQKVFKYADQARRIYKSI